jgi:hypothetical protein
MVETNRGESSSLSPRLPRLPQALELRQAAHDATKKHKTDLEIPSPFHLY